MKRFAIAMLAIMFGTTASADDTPPIEVGKPFPNIVLPTLDGRPMSMADFRGQKVLLHVFASW
jgi:hypothetical protein